MADWIPVTERLPETCAPVLVYLHWGLDDYEITVGEYWGKSKASPGWGIFDPYVTHWMPLPTPPKEEHSPVYESLKRGMEQAINGKTREEGEG